MGHGGHFKDYHATLLERLDAGQVGLPVPDDDRALRALHEILEIFFSPEHAAIAARMPVRPASLARVAQSVGIPKEELEPKLQQMCDRGLVMDLVHPRTGKVRYFLAPPVVGFFEFSLMRANEALPQKRMAEAMDAYFHADRTFADEVFGADTVVGRALAQQEQLADEERPDVLDYELATSIVRDARAVAVSLCYCRHKAEHLGHACDAPMDNCLSLNTGADFVLRHGFGRSIEPSEALELLEQAKERGLVQIADNVQKRPAYVCNCCGCCCGQLRAINDYGLPAVNPSGFVPRLDEAHCKGCSRCARACPITAIQMVASRQPSTAKNRLRPAIDAERCIGCGVCARACRNRSLELVRRTEQPTVPENVIERIARMTLERGRLHHLVFDASVSRGHRFMNRLVRTLTRLPAAEKVLAHEQIRSRFVRWAMRNVRDPTGG